MKKEERRNNLKYEIRRAKEFDERDKEACLKGIQMAMGRWLYRLGGFTEIDKKITFEKWLVPNSSWGTKESDGLGYFFILEEQESKEIMGVIQLVPGYFFNRVKDDWHLWSSFCLLVQIFFGGNPLWALRFLLFGLAEILWGGEYPTVLKDHDLFVNYLAIFPKYQSLGLGSKLLEFAEGHAKEINRMNERGESYLGLKDPTKLTHLRLNAAIYNEGAIRCYEKFGMKKDPIFNKRWDAPEVSLYSFVKPIP